MPQVLRFRCAALVRAGLRCVRCAGAEQWCLPPALQLYDHDHRGFIPPDQLSAVFAQLNGRELTPQELRHLHSYADRDKVRIELVADVNIVVVNGGCRSWAGREDHTGRLHPHHDSANTVVINPRATQQR